MAALKDGDHVDFKAVGQKVVSKFCSSGFKLYVCSVTANT